MEQASERGKLFDGLPERPLPEPRAPVKGSFARTGILPSQALKSLIAGGEIRAAPEITADQIQPASLDLRLGKVAYRIRASFLPGPNATVRDKLSELKFHEIDLTHGAVLEAGCVYLVPLIEQLNLRATIAAFANPKSSIGRIDVVVFDKTGTVTEGRPAVRSVQLANRDPLDLDRRDAEVVDGTVLEQRVAGQRHDHVALNVRGDHGAAAVDHCRRSHRQSHCRYVALAGGRQRDGRAG
jgi:hypothetical protein